MLTDHGKQLLRSSRRNVSPVELIDGPCLMGHESLPSALVECREIAQTSSRANGVLHHTPAAFNRGEVVPAMGWEEMEAKLVVVVGEGRVKLVRSRKPAAI